MVRLSCSHEAIASDRIGFGLTRNEKTKGQHSTKMRQFETIIYLSIVAVLDAMVWMELDFGLASFMRFNYT